MNLASLILCFATLPCLIVEASDFENALVDAGHNVAGTEKYYAALKPYLERKKGEQLGRINLNGLEAVREAFARIRRDIENQKPDLQIKTHLKLAAKAISTKKLRQLAVFADHLAAVNVLVGRSNVLSTRKLGGSVATRCEYLHFFVLHHGIRGHLPDLEFGKKATEDMEAKEH